MKVIRVLVYDGTEDWVDATLKRSLSGTHDFGQGSITAFAIEMDADRKWHPWLDAPPENEAKEAQ